ncbi:hypothetical protein J4401_05170 [Candidatus Woesearchaeota archaeon]|nr:hypothetical protein [Candidatus Woesearchaeota archaeon]
MGKLVYFSFFALILIGSLFYFSGKQPALNLPEGTEKVTLFKSASCGCCGAYSSWLGRKGFDVGIVNTDMASVHRKYGVPEDMTSCHMAIYGNYFVEGHIPIEAIKKLLVEKPDIKGIAMPGMPSGSPGMPGAKDGQFIIYAVAKDGSTYEFMRV